MLDFNKKYLYHYTNFEAAVKILASKEFIFSKTEKLNDINESCGVTWLCQDEEAKKMGEKILKDYKQISLSIDKDNCRGFDIPAMWGHYAGGGHGVCLVFDKERMDRVVNKYKSLYAKEVDYSKVEPNDIFYNESICGSIKKFLWSNKDVLFFHKTEDWEYEQEYRIIGFGPRPSFLDVRHSLIAVVLFARKQENFLNSVEYKALSKIGDGLEFYRYSPSSTTDSWRLYSVVGEDITPKLTYDLSLTSRIDEYCEQVK